MFSLRRLPCGISTNGCERTRHISVLHFSDYSKYASSTCGVAFVKRIPSNSQCFANDLNARPCFNISVIKVLLDRSFLLGLTDRDRSLQMEIQIYSQSVQVPAEKRGSWAPLPVFSDSDQVSGRIILDSSCSHSGRLSVSVRVPTSLEGHPT